MSSTYRSFCIFLLKGTNDIKCFSGLSLNNQYDCTSRGDVSSCQSVKGLAYSLQGRRLRSGRPFESEFITDDAFRDDGPLISLKSPIRENKMAVEDQFQ